MVKITIGIYKIINKETGQIYIGQSINIERRFKEHIRGDGCPISYIDNTIQKYGKDHFCFEIIEEFDEDTSFLDDVLNDSEQYYIAAYNTFQNDFHYNLTIGGDGTGSGENHPNYGTKLSEEAKKKISKAHFGKQLSEETKKKISEAKSGKYHSEETKKKMSKAQSGKQLSEETKKKMSESSIKKYARIIKAGKDNNKQRYAIKYQGKTIKTSISIDKLKKWFSKNYPNKELKINFN